MHVYHRTMVRAAVFAVLLLLGLNSTWGAQPMIQLPAPELGGEVTLEQALAERRSIRDYSGASLSLEQLAQLLWACQGITSSHGYRTAPSAGALYPLEIYIVVDRVEGLEPGAYHYVPARNPERHYLEDPGLDEVNPKSLSRAALDQSCIRDAAVCIVITGIVKRVGVKYGDRAEQYMLQESGHAAQNVLLQAKALGLGAVPTGAFHEDKVRALIGCEGKPLYILPVGAVK